MKDVDAHMQEALVSLGRSLHSKTELMKSQTAHGNDAKTLPILYSAVQSLLGAIS